MNNSNNSDISLTSIKTNLIINNEYITTDQYLDILSPEDSVFLGKMPLASANNVDYAYQSAKNAFELWRKLSAHERMFKLELIAQGLLSRKEEIANLLCLEIAKPIKDCVKEVERSAEYLMFTADAYRNLEGRFISGDRMPGISYMQKSAFVSYEPLGIILAISPFNYPINLAVTKFAPALVAGNTIVFKPATNGALSAYIMSQIFCEVLPKGVFNYVSGKSSEIGDYLITHKDVSMVAFTGSTKTGRHIQSITQVPVYLELGGKDAAIVLKDTNIERAVNEIIKGGFSYSAQRCTAVKRIILEESIADKFIEIALEKIKLLKVGKAYDNADITALIDKNTTQYVRELLQDAKSKNAKVLCGEVNNEVIEESESISNIILPTLLDNVDSSMRIYYEEPFGPILPIIRVKNIEEAIRIANDSQYGLEADVFTENINTAMFVASELNAGTIQINGKSDRGPDNFPFPGIKDSGTGIAGIKDAIIGMTRTKVTVINL